LPTRYWLEDKTSNINLEGKLKNKLFLTKKYAIVTVHDICPQYGTKIVELDKLDIPYNIAVVPYYDEKKKNDIRHNRSYQRTLERLPCMFLSRTKGKD